MSDFDAFLTRSFAEAERPADAGFSVRVGHAVARREAGLRVRNGLQTAGLAVGVAVVGFAVFGAAGTAVELLSGAGLEATRAMGALNDGPSVVEQATGAGAGLLQAFGLGLTQILLIAGALVGGAVAYRANQD